MKQLTAEDMKKVKAHFDYFDEDSNGILDQDEFRLLFKALAPDAKRSEADTGFAAIDVDTSGEIDFAEFLEWWQTNWMVY